MRKEDIDNEYSEIYEKRNGKDRREKERREVQIVIDFHDRRIVKERRKIKYHCPHCEYEWTEG